MFGMVIVLILVAMVAQEVHGDRRSREHLATWAQMNHLWIGSTTRRWFFLGPFFLTSSRVQRVYDVTFIDADGVGHPAVARVGGWFAGAMSDRVEVRWQ